jgi:hypothetical protein
MAWYAPFQSTTSNVRVSVRKLALLPNVIGKSMLPAGYAFMPGRML